MVNEHRMNAEQWQFYFNELRSRSQDPSAELSLEDFRALAHLELIDRVRELEKALGTVESALRQSRQI